MNIHKDHGSSVTDLKDIARPLKKCLLNKSEHVAGITNIKLKISGTSN